MTYAGGAYGDAYAPADLWTYDPVKSVWTEIEYKGPTPGPRKGHSLVYDPENDLYVLFGGGTAEWLHTDTWVYDPNANRWWEITPAVSPPWGGATWNASFGLQYDPVGKQCLGICSKGVPGLWSLKIRRR